MTQAHRTRLLIIGASGYLGGQLLAQARAAGLRVVTAGRAPLPDSPEHLIIDLASVDPAYLAGQLAQLAPDVVVNCAGATSGATDVLTQVNVTGTYALVRALLMVGNPVRLVHLGSAAEYGRSEPGVPVPESAPCQPAGSYGATKLAGTRLVQLGRSAGLDAMVLRVFNPVGPGAPEGLLPGRVAAEIGRALDTGKPISLGALDAVRDFVDSRDVVDAIIAAALSLPCGLSAGEAAGSGDGVLNIAGGVGLPVRELVTRLVAISGYDGQIREQESAGSSRSGASSWQQADISRARQVLGWVPRRDLGTSLTDLWEDRHAAIPG